MHIMSLKPDTISKLGVIVLSIVLLTGISLVPTLQIGVEGRGQTHRLTTPTTPTTPTPDLAAIGESTNQTEDGAVNQSAMVMIPQTSAMTMMSNLQAAMSAVDNDNKDEAIRALNSMDQELRSAATAAGISIENTTDGE